MQLYVSAEIARTSLVEWPIGNERVSLFTGLDWTGLDWTGLDWTGLDWTGLDWTGLHWTGLYILEHIGDVIPVTAMTSPLGWTS